MPKTVNFFGKQVVEAGAYSKIIGRVAPPTALGSFGNVVLIDTGIGAGYGFGSGIFGELESGNKAIYSFSNAEQAKAAIRGGIIWDLIDYIFSPSSNANGARTLIYARAATTTAPKYSMSFSSGLVEVICRSEGPSNGLLYAGLLSRGYAMRFKAGVVDTSKYMIEFHEGKYRGMDENGVPYEFPYDQITYESTLLFKSIEFSNVNQLIAWMQTDVTFNQYFKLGQSVASSVSLTPTDLTVFNGWLTFSGGTIVYSAAAMDEVLANMQDLDSSLFIAMDYGKNPTVALEPITIQNGANKGAKSDWNMKILNHIKNDSTYTEKILFVAGGDDSLGWDNTGTTADGSINIAEYFNDALAVVVHSGVKIQVPTYKSTSGYMFKSALYHAAMVMGRVAGLEPQNPVTYKDIRIIGLSHELKKSQREYGLKKGVLHTRYVANIGWVVNQGINTLQQNDFLFNNEGKSPEIQIMRIIHQINKDLIISATPLFVGGNQGEVSEEDVKLFVEGYLESKTARNNRSGYILSFQNITAQYVDGDYNVNYCIVPNGPVNRLFMVGVMIQNATV